MDKDNDVATNSGCAAESIRGFLSSCKGEIPTEESSNTKHITLVIPERREDTVIGAAGASSSSSQQYPRQTRQSSAPKKERRKKIVALTEAWAQIAMTHSTRETQLALLSSIDAAEESDKKILLSHLKTKQSGYKAQDTEKGIYAPTMFVTIDDIISTLLHSELACYYCKEWTKLFYEFVRDPKQWSLERLSNAEGHNRNNVVIACLECNMRRRTMYHERYLATKQLRVNKLEASGDSCTEFSGK